MSNYKNLTFYRYADSNNEWRWQLKAGNGRIIADSGEGYKQLRDCDYAISLVKNAVNVAPLT